MLSRFRKLTMAKRNGNRRNGNSKHKLSNKNGLVKPTVSSLRGIKGYLTHDDLEVLEEASKRVLKYPKQYVQKYKCASCSYEWLYNAVKCPVCSTPDVKKIA
ncbi:MAG: hypothetical protein HY513_01930 [Candidatus Aenigmarchaeota archaeon]|nr:hypothetical protein [Candidatus Aenigmarchaeota archaeon]